MINFSDLLNAIETTEYKAREYSGRGMYGKRCLGIEFDSGSELKVVAQIVRSFVEFMGDETDVDALEVCDLLDELSNYSTDSMGRGTIMYWPSIEWDMTALESTLDLLEETCERLEDVGDDAGCSLAEEVFNEIEDGSSRDLNDRVDSVAAALNKAGFDDLAERVRKSWKGRFTSAAPR